MTARLKGGAASVEITPSTSQFLFGYPHVERYSNGVHDPLFSSALYLDDGCIQVVFIANDIIFVGKDLVQRARRRIAQTTGIQPEHIMMTATHTHSGPITVNYLSNEADPAVPPADRNYLEFLENQMVTSAEKAVAQAESAEIGFSTAEGAGIGTHRRDPAGPADTQVPVLMVRSAATGRHIAGMLVCSMHPTVLHEDSTLISGDFPGMARTYLQEGILGKACPVLYHTGPCGNQSPRHVTQANTFAEAQRLGNILGQAVEKTISQLHYTAEATLGCLQEFLALPRRSFPSMEQAQVDLDRAVERLRDLRDQNAPPSEIRTAECDWFGAEETLTLSQAAAEGRLDDAYRSCLPAEIQIIKVGPWDFVGWPGEIFVEYSLAVKNQHRNTAVISLANGELQGYIVTEAAAEEGGYEASNALFSYRSGDILVEKTCHMLRRLTWGA